MNWLPTTIEEYENALKAICDAISQVKENNLNTYCCKLSAAAGGLFINVPSDVVLEELERQKEKVRGIIRKLERGEIIKVKDVITLD